MIAGRALLDTGPLVALLHRDDHDHECCREALEEFRGVLLSTEEVLTEAMYLLSRVPGGQQTCLEFFTRGAATLVPMTLPSLRRCHRLMGTYQDIPMDFADASLVTLAEELGLRRIFTLDWRGFSSYRCNRRGGFEIHPVRR